MVMGNRTNRRERRVRSHGCAAEDIVGGIGLQMTDLFPAGHYNARCVRVEPPKRRELGEKAAPLALVADALERLGECWSGHLALSECPFCGEQGAFLSVASGSKPRWSCASGCTVDTAVHALAARRREQAPSRAFWPPR